MDPEEYTLAGLEEAPLNSEEYTLAGLEEVPREPDSSYSDFLPRHIWDFFHEGLEIHDNCAFPHVFENVTFLFDQNEIMRLPYMRQIRYYLEGEESLRVIRAAWRALDYNNVAGWRVAHQILEARGAPDAKYREPDHENAILDYLRPVSCMELLDEVKKKNAKSLSIKINDLIYSHYAFYDAARESGNWDTAIWLKQKYGIKLKMDLDEAVSDCDQVHASWALRRLERKGIRVSPDRLYQAIGSNQTWIRNPKKGSMMCEWIHNVFGGDYTHLNDLADANNWCWMHLFLLRRGKLCDPHQTYQKYQQLSLCDLARFWYLDPKRGDKDHPFNLNRHSNLPNLLRDLVPAELKNNYFSVARPSEKYKEASARIREWFYENWEKVDALCETPEISKYLRSWLLGNDSMYSSILKYLEASELEKKGEHVR